MRWSRGGWREFVHGFLFTCEGNVDFGVTSGTKTLEVASYIIDARSRSSDIDMTGLAGMKIIANEAP